MHMNVVILPRESCPSPLNEDEILTPIDFNNQEYHHHRTSNTHRNPNGQDKKLQ